MWRFLNVSQPAVKKRKTEEEKLETKRNYDKTKRTRTFQQSWLKDFTWLSYDSEKNEMMCTVCSKFETIGTFVNGCSNFKLETVKIHEASECHKMSVLKNKASQNSQGVPTSTTTSVAAKSMLMINQAAKSKLRLLFRNAHYIAKLGKPYTDYKSLCELDRAKGLEIGQTYTTDKYCQKFIKAIADTIRQKQDNQIAKSHFLSIISDGATDSASKEAEIIFLRSAVEGKVQTNFIGIKNVPKADSDHISRAIIDTMTERFGQQWQQKVIGIGADGASVMMGNKAGVIQRVRENTNRPFIFAIHCSAHRLELAYKDALKRVSSKTIEKTDALLLNLYLFYRYSPLNRANLKASYDSLGMKMMIPTRVGGTRWLPHTERAVKHLLHGYKAITQHLEQMQNPDDPTHRKDSAAKAKNFLKVLADTTVVYWLHIHMDIVSCLSRASEAIQQQNVCLADVWNELESVKLLLLKYTKSDGPFTRKVEIKPESVTSIKEKFLLELISSINKRFEGDLELFKGSSFVNFKNWPVGDEDIIASYGDEDIKNLVGVCEKALLSSECELESVEPEWTRFKIDHLSRNKKNIQNLSWENLWQSMAPKYQNLFKLVSLLLTLPSSSVDAERGFSRMKILKSDWRSCLSDRNLSDQLLITSEGESVGDFDPDESILQWESASIRHRRPFVNEKEKPVIETEQPNFEAEPEVFDEEAVTTDIYQLAESLDDELSQDDDLTQEYDRETYEQLPKNIALLQCRAHKILLNLESKY